MTHNEAIKGIMDYSSKEKPGPEDYAQLCETMKGYMDAQRAAVVGKSQSGPFMSQAQRHAAAARQLESLPSTGKRELNKHRITGQ